MSPLAQPEVELMNPHGPQSANEVGQPADDAWLDEALAQSFPASDPVPHSHGDTPPQHLDEPARQA